MGGMMPPEPLQRPSRLPSESVVSRFVVDRRIALAAALSLCAAFPRPAAAQAPSREMIDRGHRMLANVHKQLRELYFDSTFGGLDLEARYRVADSAISVAPTNNHIMAAVAQFVSELNDSHTRFWPPNHVGAVDYGYRTLFAGDTCFIVGVKPESDAAAKGVKRGDALLKMDAFPIERSSFRTVRYVYEWLSPRPVVRLTLRSPDGAQRTVDVAAKITPRERTADYTDPEWWRRFWERAESSGQPNHRWTELGDSVMIWRMSSFVGEDEGNIDAMMKRVRKHRALILDLRDDGGGRVSTLEYLLGQFFDQEVPSGTNRSRSGERQWKVKPKTREPYLGTLIVLINSGSASASEMFSRVVQIEGRAIIVGDRSMGALVTSRTYPFTVGAGLIGRGLEYALQISVEDDIMSDGQRLENVGVIPDHVVLPTGRDIATRRDPQLAKALSLVGVSVTPEVAGAVYRAGPAQTTGN
jgi:carboxyl-terminal processing protease